jgi:hypothetical protein
MIDLGNMKLLYVDDCQSWIIKSNHSVFSETALQVSMLSNCLRAYSTVNIPLLNQFTLH